MATSKKNFGKKKFLPNFWSTSFFYPPGRVSPVIPLYIMEFLLLFLPEIVFLQIKIKHDRTLTDGMNIQKSLA